MDGVFVANECINEVIKKKESGVLCKLGMEKAYDKIVAFRLFHVASNKSAFVYEILSQNVYGLSWNLNFTRDLLDWKANLVANIFKSLQGVYISRSKSDYRVWSPSSNGRFSFKSFFHLISKEIF